MFNYILYRIGQFISLSLPLKAAYRIAVFFSDLHYVFVYRDRGITAKNLKAIFPQKSNREIRGIRIRMFRNFAKYLVDFFRFSKLDIDYVRKNVKVENIHYIDEVLSKGKGAIVVTAHLGNWELGGVVIALLGYPFWVVALPHKYKKVDDFFNSQRGSKGVKVIPLGKAVRQSLDILKENKVLALVGDRDFSEKGITVDFFGRPAIFPQGPAALSIKTGAGILLGFMLRNADDSFTLKFEKPLNFVPTGNKDKDLVDLTGQYRNIFQDYIRAYPDQWYVFRKFWRDA
ncbi:MAG: lysophospholipid acyltransferase family protein [Candidatus Omnitrophica bacterium]|nr:lysophospholipid acyltransferase family protein [Candidatus Omnitrophota bacterium]MDD5591755.1 lysophospholipid acyltransferase family protein [Candidatus Omnitrophota bacterium]